MSDRRIGTFVIVLAASSVFLVAAEEPVHPESLRQEGAPPIFTPAQLQEIPPLPIPVLDPGDLKRLRQVGEHISSVGSREFIRKSGHRVRTSVFAQPQKVTVTDLPWSDVGKLFFDRGSCSAVIVGSGTVLLTAAHCVRDGNTGAFFSGFQFYRAYVRGYGERFTARCVGTQSNWPDGNKGNPAADYAFIKVNETATSWLGIQSGLPYSTWSAAGYPQNCGHGQVECEVDGSKGTGTGDIALMMGNPMDKGSSGGPWIGDVTTSTNGGNIVIGINADRDPMGKNMYGPLFDQSVRTLFEYVENDCH